MSTQLSAEADRLAALARYDISGAAQEASYDGITRLAAHICDAPLAIINFIAADRQCFKSAFGIELVGEPPPLDHSICAEAIRQAEPLFVAPDLRADPRFTANPLVTRLGFRFYAGAVLRTPDGHALGALCVADHRPRDLTDLQRDALRTLALQVMTQLELRRTVAEANAEIVRRREAEAARKASEDRLRLESGFLDALIRQAPVGISIAEAPSGRSIVLNDKAFALLGHGPLGDDISRYERFGALHPDGRPYTVEDYPAVRALRFGEVVEKEEMIYRRGDGRITLLEFSSAPVRDADGRIVASVTIFTDIEEQRRTENALHCARVEAERADISKSRFLAAASHDLRQPLQSLLLFLDVLKPHVAPGGVEPLLHLGRGLDAMKDLLDSLLDISRLDAGVVQPTVEEFCINDLIEEVATCYRPLAAAKGVAFEARGCAGAVRSDRTLLGRMVRNLVENALRYTESGCITVVCRLEADRLRIEVHDTGIGIPPEHLAWIWDEFHQVANIERDRNRGFGLGLSIVQRLSTLLDHPVDVRSTPGRGSVFVIHAPLGRMSQECALTTPANDGGEAAADGAAGRFAVLVEDDAIVLLGLRATFEAWGYRVLAAGSADQAMDGLRSGARRRPDVVVADYRLREGRCGTEAILRVRELYGQDVPGIILTGETGPEAQRDALAHGFGLIHKPVTPRQLGEAIDRILAAA